MRSTASPAPRTGRRAGVSVFAATALLIVAVLPGHATPPRPNPLDADWAESAVSPAEAPEARNTVLVQAQPSAESERLRLQQALGTTNFQPTGAYLPPETSLAVRVDARDGLAPTLHVGAPSSHADEDFHLPREYPLEHGLNEITDPGGGMLYLSLIGDGERARVTLAGGALRAPTYVLGRTSESTFQYRLDEWSASPYVELVSDRAIVTVSREGFLDFRDEDHAALMETFEAILASHDEISGLDGSTQAHTPTDLNFHLVESPRMPDGAGAYATHGWTAYPRSYLDRLITVEGLAERGWGVWHELGHQYHQMAYKPADLTEVNVNIYSLAWQRTSGLPSNLNQPDEDGLTLYDHAFAKLEQGTDFLDYSVMERLVMIWQLDLAFGQDFWPQLHQLTRELDPQTELEPPSERYNQLGYLASITAGYDLTEFFDTWQLPYDEDGRQMIADLGLPEPPVDPSTVRE